MSIFLVAVIYAFTITGINQIMPTEQHKEKAGIKHSVVVIDGVAYETTTVELTGLNGGYIEPTVSIGW